MKSGKWWKNARSFHLNTTPFLSFFVPFVLIELNTHSFLVCFNSIKAKEQEQRREGNGQLFIVVHFLLFFILINFTHFTRSVCKLIKNKDNIKENNNKEPGTK